MTGYERYMGVVHGTGADVLPRIPIVMQFAAEFIGSHYGAFAAEYQTLVQANLRCAEAFGFDQVSAISDPYRETEGFGGTVTYIRDGVPRCTAPLEEVKDLALLKTPDPLVSMRMLDRVEAIRAYARECRGRYSILGWVEGPAAEAADLRGVMNFLTDTAEDPAFTELLMDRCLETGIAFARAQIQAGADTVGIGDAIASQISPEFYGAVIQPREKVLIRAIQESGALARLHICGDITHLLPGIRDLGVDILDLDHMVDPAKARAAVGPDVVLSGNIDPVGGVMQGRPDTIRAIIKATYAAAGNPFMVNAGCEIPARTPPEHLAALCEPIPYAT